MCATSLITIAKQSVGWSIGLSILMILAGVLAIVVPPAAGIAVTIFVGWLLIFSGRRTSYLVGTLAVWGRLFGNCCWPFPTFS